mmetsp:Transcript_31711/g.36988  ORF Transcript_31711/g.36988 Transcript_31711/m.36988 type:complete len:309 (+) Transcript_31711:55-981(+)
MNSSILTPLDLERRPYILPNDYKSQIKLPLKHLNNSFLCPICLSYMKKTYIVMECLHRFCGDCIQKCLRMGKKECPSCRVHIPSRRSLRPDKNYDSLMEGIYGDIETLEAREEKQIEVFNKKKNMNNAYSQSRDIKKLQQSNQWKKGNNKLKQEQQTRIETITKPVKKIPRKTVKIYHLKESPLIEFVLRKHPLENSVPRLYRECIKVSQEMTVGHIKKFLGKKLAHQPWSHFQIAVNAGGRLSILDKSIKLREIRSEICDFQEGVMFTLQYFIQRFALDDEFADGNEDNHNIDCIENNGTSTQMKIA